MNSQKQPKLNKWTNWLNLVEILESEYSMNWSDNDVRIKYDMLAHIHPELLKVAVFEHIQNSPFAPKTSDLIKAVKKVEQPKWEIAYMKAFRNVNDMMYGHSFQNGKVIKARWSENDTENAIIDQTVKRFGGVNVLANVPNGDPISRAQFRDIFNIVMEQYNAFEAMQLFGMEEVKQIQPAQTPTENRPLKIGEKMIPLKTVQDEIKQLSSQKGIDHD